MAVSESPCRTQCLKTLRLLTLGFSKVIEILDQAFVIRCDSNRIFHQLNCSREVALDRFAVCEIGHSLHVVWGIFQGRCEKTLRFIKVRVSHRVARINQGPIVFGLILQPSFQMEDRTLGFSMNQQCAAENCMSPPGILIFRQLHGSFRFGKSFLVPLFGQIEQSE